MDRIISEDQWEPVGVDALEKNADSVVRSRGNKLVVAGPGAGKTELLAQRANFLLATGRCPAPKRILAISFKRDAAANLKERVNERCGDLAERFDSFTLDAFAKNLVDRFRMGIPPEWRPGSSYEVRTESIDWRYAKDWMVEAPIPKGLVRPQIEHWDREKVNPVFARVMHGGKLPYDDPGYHPLHKEWGLHWWKEQLSAPSDQPSITFPMLNRLATYMLQCNPRVIEALRATYGYLFFDEFQDTTEVQWDLVTLAFGGSSTTLTAVGDDKQRIMVWAGAMPDAFERVENEFEAERIPLLSNYRSAPELVRIQHQIAFSMEGEAVEAIPTGSHEGGGVCQIWEFPNAEAEAEYIAELIDIEIKKEGTEARDYCVLVRQDVPRIISPLKGALGQREIALRDESQLQDLHAEPLTKIVLATVRLAIHARDPAAWSDLCRELRFLTGVSGERDGLELEQLANRHKDIAMACLGEQVSEPFINIPNHVINLLGDQIYRGAYPQYGTGNYLYEVAEKLGKALQLSFEETSEVSTTIDHFPGKDIIPAMTIHKSKGLEFDTVIFVGLEDGQWWNFRNKPDEEKRAFFVAFSRAIRRVIFTFSGHRETRFGLRRQVRKDIDDLYTVLRNAGVEVVEHTNLS